MDRLVELLRQRAENAPEHPVFCWQSEDARTDSRLTLGELDHKARAVAVELARLGAAGGDAILMFPPGLDFIVAFWGCLYAGTRAIPAPMPQPNRLSRTLPRLESTAESARPALLLTEHSGMQMQREICKTSSTLRKPRWLAVDDLNGDADEWRPPSGGRRDVAYVQYTSGSTSSPKGVLVSHENVLVNSEYIRQAKGYDPSSISVVWVPNYHDDGLIHGIIQPIYSGCRAVIMSAAAFVNQPVSWLRTIAKHRATHAGGPNFAYELCVRKVSDKDARQIDLSSWRFAYNAAEPIHPETLRAFAEKFGPSGFKWAGFAPCYGLAEATLTVTVKSASEGPRLFAVDLDQLQRHNRVRAAGEFSRSKVFVGCGAPVGDTSVAIVDPVSSRGVEAGRVGEIWVKSPCVTSGYHEDPDRTEKTFAAFLADGGGGPFLRTGDLGFLSDGELFVTGRLKDVLIVRGENRYPEDIEWTAQNAHRAIRPGAVVTFAVEASSTDAVVLAAEVRVGDDRGTPDQLCAQVVAAVRHRVLLEHAIEVETVVLLEPGRLPKTSSGKLPRQLCRQAFLSGNWEPLYSSTLSADRERRRATEISTPVAAPVPRQAAEIEIFLRAFLAGRLGDAARIDFDSSLPELGLDSLAAATLMTALSNWLGRKLTESVFFEHPTLRALCAQLGDRHAGVAVAATPAPISEAPSPALRPVSRTLLVALRPVEARRQPFFCIPPLSGLPANLWNLACFLGDDHPLITFEYPGLDGKEPAIPDVAKLAQCFLEEVRRVQPRGPYCLGGYSYGGLIAFEMAQMLSADGQHVSRLVLIDSGVQDAAVPDFAIDREAGCWEAIHLFHSNEAKLESEIPCPADFAKMTQAQQVALLVSALARRNTGVSPQQAESLVSVWESNSAAALRYVPTPTRVPVTLLTPERFRLLPKHPARIPAHLRVTTSLWASLCQGEFECLTVPGDHLTMLELPDVKHLARSLSGVLAAANQTARLQIARGLRHAFPSS